eukprot:TRINITY_DN9591_c0_g1_i1.p1 TRINITY_DN9591_c0_g1~~TRINITY_DN9591_c0_g1_i1.p1  ORF type:complete len:332 (-),score=137.36 TRINITY_DN9591_c0_g1_i1:149-1144(-)
MIKRTLGVWGAGSGGKADSDDDSEEELTPAQRRKLERRLLPGAANVPEAPSKRKGAGNQKVTQQKVEEEDSDEDEDDDGDEEEEDEEEAVEEDDEAEDDEASDDQHPVVPEPKEQPFRGNFKCQLCPNKIILSEKALEDHLQSGEHKKNEKRFQRAQELGVKAYTEECKARAEERARAAEDLAARGGVSVKKQKNQEYWQKKRGKQKNSRKEAQKSRSADEIEDAKQKFQAKKARRLERREAEGKSKAASAKVLDDATKKQKQKQPAPAAVVNGEAKKPNRKQRRAEQRALKFGHNNGDVGKEAKKQPAAEVKKDVAAEAPAAKKRKKKQG